MNNDPALTNSGYQIDQILGGRYRILSVLGKGGMGIVLRVEQIFIGKEFALKTIDKNLLSEVTIRRFKQEAKATFAVSHPNIISVNDFGLLDDETPFMVMEIVSGKTLSTRLKETTSLPIEDAIPIFIQVCFGLAHAHESGIVHRDIKPSNIMLPDPTQTPAGTVKILDFGIAKFTQDGGESQALTKTGEIFGSPLYMSPEQCSGSNVDHRSDVYSLGCVLFETLTGTPPFIGETALSTMMKHQSAPIPTLKEASLGGEFPKDLERMMQAMLAKNPNERYQNLGVTAHDLSSIINSEGQAKLVKSIPVSAPIQKKSNRAITISRNTF
ncbi:MAG: serine/threonine protein kinase, partial [Leptolyngbya sp.]|nr:serine/threonine protein kinase [Candidatus Melainabacteria bacterium]